MRARPSGSGLGRASRGPGTLCLDIGGTWIKAVRLGGRGPARVLRVPTPRPATPATVLRAIRALAAEVGEFERVAAGFPGVVRAGVVLTAPNLAPKVWHGRRLARDLERVLGRPARVANDAVLHGLGAVRGRGVELLLTLGTGLGSVLFVEGRALPLELGHLPWEEGRSFEQNLGEAARRRAGTRAWRSHVGRAVKAFRAALQPDAIYLGGGNAARLRGHSPDGTRLVPNEAALRGGLCLWEREGLPTRARTGLSASGR